MSFFSIYISLVSYSIFTPEYLLPLCSLLTFSTESFNLPVLMQPRFVLMGHNDGPLVEVALEPVDTGKTHFWPSWVVIWLKLTRHDSLCIVSLSCSSCTVTKSKEQKVIHLLHDSWVAQDQESRLAHCVFTMEPCYVNEWMKIQTTMSKGRLRHHMRPMHRSTNKVHRWEWVSFLMVQMGSAWCCRPFNKAR